MDPYETLGVSSDAAPGAVAAAFRERARRVHPDRHPGASPARVAELGGEMALLSHAYTAILAERRGSAPPAVDRPQRAPASGECSMCGHAPGIEMTFEYQRGVLVWRRHYLLRTWLCRDCGRAIGRGWQDRTLRGGLWGPTLLVRNVGVVNRNARQLRLAATLAPPQPVRDVKAGLPAPIGPAHPVCLREGFWVVMAVGSFLLVTMTMLAASWIGLY